MSRILRKWQNFQAKSEIEVEMNRGS